MTLFVPAIGMALWLSFKVALASIALGLPFALFMGFILARKQFLAKPVVAGLCMAPAVIPPVVLGFLLLRCFSPNHSFGQWLINLGIEIPFSFLGAVIAATAVGIPFYVMGIRTAISAVDPIYAEVASSLGMNPWQAFWRVEVPLAWPGIAGAAVMAFARALGEFGVTAVLAGNTEGKTRTLSLAVYSLLEHPDGEDQIWLLVALSMALALVTLIIYESLIWWQRQRLAQGNLSNRDEDMRGDKDVEKEGVPSSHVRMGA